jgi:hypothetical protein
MSCRKTPKAVRIAPIKAPVTIVGMVSVADISSSGFGALNVYQIMIGIVVGIGTILYLEGLKRGGW